MDDYTKISGFVKELYILGGKAEIKVASRVFWVLKLI